MEMEAAGEDPAADDGMADLEDELGVDLDMDGAEEEDPLAVEEPADDSLDMEMAAEEEPAADAAASDDDMADLADELGVDLDMDGAEEEDPLAVEEPADDSLDMEMAAEEEPAADDAAADDDMADLADELGVDLDMDGAEGEAATEEESKDWGEEIEACQDKTELEDLFFKAIKGFLDDSFTREQFLIFIRVKDGLIGSGVNMGHPNYPAVKSFKWKFQKASAVYQNMLDLKSQTIRDAGGDPFLEALSQNGDIYSQNIFQLWTKGMAMEGKSPIGIVALINPTFLSEVNEATENAIGQILAQVAGKFKEFALKNRK